MSYRILYFALFMPVALLAACLAPAPLRPTPTAIVTVTPAPPPAVRLVDSELLGAAGIHAACDHPAEAQLDCRDEATHPALTANVPASSYARWSLKWDAADTALTGDETLTLHTQLSGNLNPNLYLVERGGRRVPVTLNRFGLGEGTHAVHVPLREIKDENGKPLDFAQVNEVQLVFEWADMAGELALDSVRFDSAWREPVVVGESSQALAAGLTVPAGFTVEAVADNLPALTQMEFTPDGDLLVSLQEGRIWRYSDTNGDGQYDERLLYTTGFTEVVGLLYDPTDGAVWVGGRGQLTRTHDDDGNGVADVRELRLDGLPWGRHQNNGLEWNPDPDPFTGEPGRHWIYFGLGSTDDLVVGGDLNASVLRFPRDGQGQGALEVVSHGNRNAYDVVWAPVPVDLAQPEGATAWQLFASENGPDFNDAPDEVNHVRWGMDFGFPDQFGPVTPPAVDGEPYSGPVFDAGAHTSADGVAYITNRAWPAEYRTLYVALFGEVFNPAPAGHTIERVTLSVETLADGSVTYRGVPSDFVVGMDRPLPLTVAPDGNLMAGDYATGVVYRISYSGG